jgi:rRNA maturation endonuclease Nob1
MIKAFKSLIIIIFFSSITIHANSETSWITKKDSNKKKIVKETKTETSNWIKKKEVKENKKKLKEKIKESKSWITKKSKEKVKDIKNNLKKHKDIDKLPKAEFYFAAVIKSDDGEDSYIYGYVNSDKKSSTFNFNNKSYYKKSDGIAYFEDKENR